MLVLSRRPGEAIQIGEARVEVLSVRGNRVTLGISAGKTTRILREEVATRNERPARRPVTIPQ